MTDPTQCPAGNNVTQKELSYEKIDKQELLITSRNIRFQNHKNSKSRSSIKTLRNQITSDL